MPVTTQDCSGLVALFLRHGLLPHTDTRPFWLPPPHLPESLSAVRGRPPESAGISRLGTSSQASVAKIPPQRETKTIPTLFLKVPLTT